MPATTVIGVVLAGVAFVLRLLEWLGVRPQNIRQTLSGGKIRAVLIVFVLYDLFLVGTMLASAIPSDFMWWALLVLVLWTVFTLLRVLLPVKPVQIASNIASSAAVLFLTVVSWRLSEDWRFPLVLSIMTAIWVITLLVEAGSAVRRKET